MGIGRLVFRAAMANSDVEVKGINDPFMDLEYMVYQLKYDSVHKRYPGTIATKVEDGKKFLVVDDKAIQIFAEKDPAAIPWGACGAHYVCESTGVFTAKEKAELHIKGGCKKSHNFSTSQGCSTNLCDWRQPHRIQNHGHSRLERFMYHQLLGATH